MILKQGYLEALRRRVRISNHLICGEEKSISTHEGTKGSKGLLQCVYDGGEIGFDIWASLQNTNANDNFAPSGFALAA